MGRALPVLWGSVLVGLAACSSSKPRPGGVVQPDPVQQCDAFVDKYCAKMAPCQSETTTDCASQLNAQFEQYFNATCSGADKVSAHYDACLTDLDAYACGEPMPSSCVGVILFYP